MAAAKLDHDLLRRFVLHRTQALQRGLAASLQLFFRKQRAAQHVGKDGDRGGQVLGQSRPAIGDPRW